MALDLQLVESNRISAHNLGLILFAELGNVLLHDIHHLSIFTAQRHHYSSLRSLLRPYSANPIPPSRDPRRTHRK